MNAFPLVMPLARPLANSLARSGGVVTCVVTGNAYPGETLWVVNPLYIHTLMDDGELLLDDGQPLAYGAVEGGYQWYLNGVAVEGANDIFFTVPEYANDGDRITVNTSRAVIVRSIPFEIVSADYTVAHRFVSSEEEPVGVTELDRLLISTTSANVVTDYKFEAKVQGTVQGDAWSFASSDQAIATVDPVTGNVAHVADGNAIITATLRDAIRTFPLVLSTSQGATVDVFLEFEEGSVARDASEAVDSRIATAHDPTTNLRIFTTQNHTSQIYTRNPNVWCADLDLTCISPWNSSGGAQRAVTLISPRHVIMAAHYEAAVGATVRFVTMDGTVVNRTMTARMRHPDYVPHYPDLTIGLLDSDVPAGITFAKILPDDWANYLPSLASGAARIPTIGLDQEEKATVQDTSVMGNGAGFRQPLEIPRMALYESKITGDSGNPAFMVIDGQLVLLTVWTYGGAGGGTGVTAHRTALDSVMSSLGGGYNLTPINLETFNSYI
jgi:hypothetical protein